MKELRLLIILSHDHYTSRPSKYFKLFKDKLSSYIAFLYHKKIEDKTNNYLPSKHFKDQYKLVTSSSREKILLDDSVQGKYKLDIKHFLLKYTVPKQLNSKTNLRFDLLQHSDFIKCTTYKFDIDLYIKTPLKLKMPNLVKLNELYIEKINGLQQYRHLKYDYQNLTAHCKLDLFNTYEIYYQVDLKNLTYKCDSKGNLRRLDIKCFPKPQDLKNFYNSSYDIVFKLFAKNMILFLHKKDIICNDIKKVNKWADILNKLHMNLEALSKNYDDKVVRKSELIQECDTVGKNALKDFNLDAEEFPENIQEPMPDLVGAQYE